MPKKPKIRAFVPYSRHDEKLVKPLSELVGVATEEVVFVDVDSLKPGELWDDEITRAIKQASVFVLCWCCASAKSKAVAKEIEQALKDKKRKLVPVLFCPQKLPRGFAERQWIDLRGRIKHLCVAKHPAPKRRRKHIGDIHAAADGSYVVERKRNPHTGPTPRMSKAEEIAARARLF